MSIQYIRGQLTDIDPKLYDASLNNDGLIIRVSKTDASAPLVIPNKFALSCIVQGDGVVYVNTGTVLVPAWSAVPITGDLTVTGTLSSAQILTIFSLPVTILPSPGLGLAYLPTYTMLRYNFGTIAYLAAPGGSIRLATGATIFAAYQNNFLLNALQDEANGSIVGTGGTTFRLQANTAMTLFSPGAPDPINGDGTIDYEIHYQIITL